MARQKSVEIFDDVEIRDEVKYYDVLYNFARASMRINELALDGESKNMLQRKIKKLIPSFIALCGVDMDDKIDWTKVEQEKQEEPIKQAEPLPDNFMKEENGWGLCPVCRLKVVKLTSTTRIIDFPIYCKACKTEYIMNWWNVENKHIAYTRQINNRPLGNKHFAGKNDIRNQGMKGTGLQRFRQTRTSATERAAMHL
ncbi:MAG: cysteine-rich KTR domain-containing protein [Roseburia sp.]